MEQNLIEFHIETLQILFSFSAAPDQVSNVSAAEQFLDKEVVLKTCKYFIHLFSTYLPFKCFITHCHTPAALPMLGFQMLALLSNSWTKKLFERLANTSYIFSLIGWPLAPFPMKKLTMLFVFEFPAIFKCQTCCLHFSSVVFENCKLYVVRYFR